MEVNLRGVLIMPVRVILSMMIMPMNRVIMMMTGFIILPWMDMLVAIVLGKVIGA